MAESYRTEEEQIEALKKWWQDNGKSTVVSIVVAIAAVFGWQGWQQKQQADTDAASAVYQDMLVAVNATATAEQLATARHLANTLKQDFSNSTYARFAALYKAKLAVEDNDLAGAEQELRWVLERGITPELELEVKLRLARVLYAQDRFDEALQQLQGDASGFAAAYEEARGDIYLAQDDSKQALLAYQKASELNRQAQQPVNRPMLEMKLQQLKSKQGQIDGTGNVGDNSEGA